MQIALIIVCALMIVVLHADRILATVPRQTVLGHPNGSVVSTVPNLLRCWRGPRWCRRIICQCHGDPKRLLGFSNGRFRIVDSRGEPIIPPATIRYLSRDADWWAMRNRSWQACACSPSTEADPKQAAGLLQSGRSCGENSYLI